MKTTTRSFPIALDNGSGTRLADTLNSIRHRTRGVSDQQTVQDALDDIASHIARQNKARGDDAKQRILDDPIAVVALNAVIRNLVNVPLSETQTAYLRAIGTTTTPGSSFIVDHIGSDLYDVIAAHGAWATLGVRPVRSTTGKFPVTTAIPNAQFITENNSMSDDTAMTGSSLSATIPTIGVLLNVSFGLAEDLDADLAPDFLEKFERSFNARLDNAVFSGTGANDGDNGGTTGLFVDANVPVVTAAAGNTTVETLDLEDFLRVLDAAPAGVLQRKPAWWMNPSLLVKALRINDASGSPMVHILPTPDGASFSILGFPVHLVAAAPSSNTISKKVAIFGEPGGYLVGLRQAFTLERSAQYKWNTGQFSYRGIGRAKGALRDSTAFVALKTAAA